MTQHTATPWIVEHTNVFASKSAVVFCVADCFGNGPDIMQAKANAAHIVRAVNAHDDLVLAVEACLAMLDNRHWNGDMVAHARAALAKARADQRK